MVYNSLDQSSVEADKWEAISFQTKWILPLTLGSDLTLQAIQSLNINPKLNSNHRYRQTLKKTDIPEAMLIRQEK